MAKIKDMTGQKFGRLTVTEYSHQKYNSAHWKCLCSCGKIVVVDGRSLRKGATKSCGCLHNEEMSKRQTTHGRGWDKNYSRWHAMMSRCYNEKDQAYKNYGGRGIKVCEEWHDVEKYISYIESIAPTDIKNMTVDRVDNNGDYKPGNIRWASIKTQNRNSRNNSVITTPDGYMTIAEAAEKYDIKYHTLSKRINKYEWSIEKAINDPIQIHKKKKKM